uniref:Zinc finger DHHC-type containing 15 n=1 Tax=Junco hyemalis TaxID=40217 RepID=A0A8C5IF03_JUNHY
MRFSWTAIMGGTEWTSVFSFLLFIFSLYCAKFELCPSWMKPLLKSLLLFHILFVLFVWTYWKSVFTLPIQPGKKFHMSYADQERYENEERPEVQRQILAEIARKLPVYTRTGNGGQAGTEPQPPQSQPAHSRFFSPLFLILCPTRAQSLFAFVCP